MSLSTEFPLKQKETWKTAAVLASALCLLLLSTPGVRVVRASDDIAEDPGGQACQTADSAVNERITVPLDRSGRHDASGEPVHALNNTGFNYQPAAAPAAPTPRPDIR